MGEESANGTETDTEGGTSGHEDDGLHNSGTEEDGDSLEESEEDAHKKALEDAQLAFEFDETDGSVQLTPDYYKERAGILTGSIIPATKRGKAQRHAAQVLRRRIYDYGRF